MIEVRDLYRTYHNGSVESQVLKGIDLTINSGEFVAIIGRSGAGKSTLLYQMSLLDKPTKGTITIDGRLGSAMTQNERVAFRLTNLGYVFQDYALVPELTAVENVALPLLMQGVSKTEAYAAAREILERMGVGNRVNALPSTLSGGEQQRVSIARAVAHHPHVLFADEPTANLDRESSDRVMCIFEELHREGQTIIMVTHEEEYAALAERVITIDDGRVVKDERDKK